MKFTSVADSSQMEHAKKSQELQSGVSLGCTLSTKLLCHEPGNPRDNCRSCPGTVREPKNHPWK